MGVTPPADLPRRFILQLIDHVHGLRGGDRVPRSARGHTGNNNITGWGPALCARRPDITMAMVDAFVNKMHRANADFVFTVTRDFAPDCQTPILVLPDDGPAHPHALAMETRFSRRRPKRASTRGRTPSTRFPWRCATCAPFCRAHQPVAAAAQ